MNIYRIPVHAQYSASYYFEVEAPDQKLAEHAIEDAAGSILDASTHVSMPTKPIHEPYQWFQNVEITLTECDDRGNDFDWQLGRSVCLGKANEIERNQKQKKLDKLKAEIAKLEAELKEN